MQVQLEKIPQFLKDNGQFCCWQYEMRGGDKTKVPYTPGTTRRANVKIPATFTAFETAASATGYDGIGIRVCAGSWASTWTTAWRMASCSLGRRKS